MHCQPAHLEEEITTELFDSDMSVVFQQAENRMWAQNAVLVNLFTN
jgi:ornithine carbamoyltransferase